jgi:hypothetical protein
MHEITGDLFKSVRADAICITTNGWTKKDGSCVMGRGCADQAKKLWPGIEFTLGEALSLGNRPHLLTYPTEHSGGKQLVLPVPGLSFKVPYHVLSFPVKPTVCVYSDLLPRFATAHVKEQDKTDFPGWMSQAKFDIICNSARNLMRLAESEGWKSVVIPRPGCGAGGLQWKHVKEHLEVILDDKFYIIDFPKR